MLCNGLLVLPLIVVQYRQGVVGFFASMLSPLPAIWRALEYRTSSFSTSSCCFGPMNIRACSSKSSILGDANFFGVIEARLEDLASSSMSRENGLCLVDEL